MEHSAYKEKLSALFDGELSGAEREDALAHMDGCADCRAYFAELTALRAAFGGLEKFDAPEDFAAGVMARLRADGGSAPKTREKRSARRGYAALAACAAVVLLAVYALPNTLRMGGNSQSVRADSVSNAAPAAAPGEPAAPSPGCDYAYAGGDSVPESVREERGAADTGFPAAAEDRAAEGTVKNSAVSGETYSAAMAEPGEKLSASGMDETPVTPLSGSGTYDGEPPILTLSGEGAEGWLAEHGWQGESGSWYADAWTLRALPDGFTILDGELPEDYDGAVLIELWEAEP